MEPSIMNGNQPRGHLLLVALFLITLLSLMLAMAIQPINTTRERMLEEELIYRGEHLATGIRRFYQAKGRFPFELEELVSAQPRFVRKLYKDPMSEDGEWTLVYLQPLDFNNVRGLNSLTQNLTGLRDQLESNSENIDDKQPGLSRDPNSVFGIKDQQITGIRSKSQREGLTIREDSRLYSDWLFSALPKAKQEESLADKILGGAN